MISNAGVFEGHLAHFDRCGCVASPKTPTILYVYCNTTPDAGKLRAKQPPSSLIFTLRRTQQQCDGSQSFFYGPDMIAGGRVFNAAGSMCSGARYITKGGSRVFVEININFRPRSRPPQLAPIAGRVRAVVIYSAEGHFESVSLFTERPREGESESPPVTLPPHPQTVRCANAGFLVANSACVDATPDALAGGWTGVMEEFGPDGLCVLGAVCGRAVEATGGTFSVRDVGSDGRDGEGEIRGESFIALRTPSGVDHWLQLGGGLWCRAPLVINFSGTSTIELGWLVEPDHLLSTQRTYSGGAWRSSKFTDEFKNAT